MAPLTKTNVCQNFSFSTGSWLKWDDEAPALTQEEKSEDDQSIDSDHSSDFFHNFNPTVEKMIIARRATYLKELEEQIAKDEAKIKPKPKPIKPKQKTHPREMQLRSPSKQKQSGKAPENQIPPRGPRQENPTTTNTNTNRTTKRQTRQTRERDRNSNCKSKGRKQTKTTTSKNCQLAQGKKPRYNKPPCNLLEIPLPTQRQGAKMQMETTRVPTETKL